MERARSGWTKVVVGAFLLTALVSSGLLLTREPSSCAPGGGALSVYEWRTSEWSTDNDAAELIRAAEDLCVTTVYVDVTGLAVAERRDAIERALGALLDRAAESPVTIGALAGDPWWASPEGVVDATLVMDGLARVSQGREAPIESLHFDVEPWGLDEWSDSKTMLVESYLEFVTEMVEVRDQARAPRLQLSFLIPYWFDGSNGEAPRVVHGGVDAFPFQHLASEGFTDVSWIVMAYRDRAEGEGGVIELLGQETATSQRVGLALETAPVEPMTITFADEELTDLDAELAAIFDADLGLVEVVINDLEHLRVLADRAAILDTAPSG